MIKSVFFSREILELSIARKKMDTQLLIVLWLDNYDNNVFFSEYTGESEGDKRRKREIFIHYTHAIEIFFSEGKDEKSSGW